MDVKVFLSLPALSDLERIVAYIALDDLAAATRVGNQLLDAALSLGTSEKLWTEASASEG